MIKFLKIVGAGLLGLVLSIGAFLLWHDRSQKIDFIGYLPASLETCNGTIETGSVEYTILKQWLESNKANWHNYIVTAAPGYFYRGKEIAINILKASVVINYHDGRNWTQVINNTNTDEVNGVCQNNI